MLHSAFKMTPQLPKGSGDLSDLALNIYRNLSVLVS